MSRRLWLAAMAGGALVGLSLGVLVGVNGLGLAAPAAADLLPEDRVTDGYVSLPPLKVNTSGQTYGSLIGRGTSLESAPDLVEVIGNNGKLGYVEKIHFFGEVPTTPDEVAAANARADELLVVPVFASDGKTKVDTFTLNKGASSSSR